MYIILLKFSKNRGLASKYMDEHIEWLKQGFEDGVFIVAGSIKPNSGGAIVAIQSTMEQIQNRVNQDPFVVEKIVEPEVVEINPSKMDDRLLSIIK